MPGIDVIVIGAARPKRVRGVGAFSVGGNTTGYLRGSLRGRSEAVSTAMDQVCRRTVMGIPTKKPEHHQQTYDPRTLILQRIPA